VANALAQGCANAQAAADQVVNCAIANIGSCIGGGGGGGIFQCFQSKCSAQFATCLGATCN
jgi:hypothetical protein